MVSTEQYYNLVKLLGKKISVLLQSHFSLFVLINIYPLHVREAVPNFLKLLCYGADKLQAYALTIKNTLRGAQKVTWNYSYN